MVFHARTSRAARTGRQPMAPLKPSLACAPAEALRTSQGRSIFSFKQRKTSLWRLGTWNTRSLLDAEGPIETARQGRDAVQAEDRRADLVIRELSRYTKVAALQETKWFGSGIYHVGDSIVLASGRKIPTVGEPAQRGEGVALVLSSPAVAAWKDGGEHWKAWSSRLISAKLQLNSKQTGKLHVLSWYAPI